MKILHLFLQVLFAAESLLVVTVAIAVTAYVFGSALLEGATRIVILVDHLAMDITHRAHGLRAACRSLQRTLTGSKQNKD